MMMMPSIFGENLFDDWMDDFSLKNFFKDEHNPLLGKREKNLMKTDVKQTDNAYVVDMDLPGLKKEDVKAQLKDGYLTISASRGVDKDEKDETGNYIRRERYTGQCSRTFFVGKGLKQEDIKAKFENGILSLTFPKEEVKSIPKEEYIAIEG